MMSANRVSALSITTFALLFMQGRGFGEPDTDS
jgi:hypothetical protein